MCNLGVFICVYNRLDKLPATLDQLDKQSFKDFDLHILNNNFSKKDIVDQIISENKGNLSIDVKHNEINLGPMVRFFEAKKSSYDYVIFLDDDESFVENTIETLNSEKAPKSMSARIAANFDNNFNVRRRVASGFAKYLGPGGMIADASIFRMENFWKEWKPEFYVTDDLWLSYFAEKLGWKKTASKVFIKLEFSGPESMLKNPVIKDLKQAFVEQYKWF